MDNRSNQTKPSSSTSSADGLPGVVQNVIAVGGFAYGVINGDVHVHGDGRPMYTLEVHRPKPGPPLNWLLELPSRLLDARHQIIPFTGRETEIQALTGWRDSPARLSVLFLHGPGGQGKTRLAARFAELSLQAGWKIVYARHGGDTITGPDDSQDLTPGNSPGLLLLVDYADRWPHSHLEWLLRNRLLHTPVPTRVLLIGRSVHGWPAFQHALNEVHATTQDLALTALAETVAEREAMFDAACDRYTNLYKIAGGSEIGAPSRLDDPSYELVLSIHMAALVAVDAYQHGEQPPSDPARLSAYLLNREHAHWARLHARTEHGGTFHTPPDLIAKATFVAALTGQQPNTQAEALLAKLQDRQKWDLSADQVLADHAICYLPDEGMALEPLYPDRLAEDFLALTLPGHNVTGYSADPWAAKACTQLLERDTDGEPPGHISRAITFLAAAADRWPHLGDAYLYPLLRDDPQLALASGSAVLTALAANRGIGMDVLGGIEGLFGVQRYVDLDVGIAALFKRLTEYRLANTTDEADRASLHHVLSWRLADAGRYDEALNAAEQAAMICRRLAEADPTMYLPELASSLNNLGVRLRDLGQRDEALAAIEEAVGVYWRLAAVRPKMFLPYLAKSLTNLGVSLSALGRRDDVLPSAEDAIRINRQLAEADPATYLPELAGSLNNLGVWLKDLGRHEEALTATEEAVSIRQRLAESNSAAYLPDLALSSNNLGMRLAEMGRLDDALAPAEEATGIYRRLAEANPAAHLPDLAMSLCNLGTRLAEIGQLDDALAPAEEATEIYWRLAEANPAVHLPDLAMSMSNLGVWLSKLGRREEALAHAEEAVAMRRRLADADPAAYAADLAASLNNLGAFLSGIGRREEALGPAKEAVSIRRRLAEATPAAYLPDLARSLTNLGEFLSGLGQRKEALAPTEEATGIYRRLAEATPASYLPDLAKSRWAYVWICVKVDRNLPEAVEALREAVALYRPLAERWPQVFGAELRSASRALAEVEGVGPVGQAADLRYEAEAENTATGSWTNAKMLDGKP